MADMATKGRRARITDGENNCRAKLSETDVRAIRASDEMGIALAEQYGVTPTTISQIRLGQTWNHVHG